MKKTNKVIKIKVPKTVDKKILKQWVKEEVESVGDKPYLTLGSVGAWCELCEMEDSTKEWELYPFLKKSVLKKNPDTKATVGYQVEFINL